MTATPAAAMIATERDVDRDVVELARLLTLASRIEPELVREMRLACLPSRDVGVESELWFSALVQSRNTSALTLFPDVVDSLRCELALQRDHDTLRRARTVVQRVHHGASPALRMEEEVVYLALVGTPEATTALEGLLGGALKAVLAGDAALASWAAGMLPRLPENARLTEAAMALAIEASRQLGGLPVSGVATVAGAAWNEHLMAALRREPVGLRLLSSGIEVSHPPAEGSAPIDVPRTDPFVLDVAWAVEDGWQSSRESLPHDTRRVIPAPLGPAVRITTLAGDSHRLRPALAAADPLIVFLRISTRDQTANLILVHPGSLPSVAELGWTTTDSATPIRPPDAICLSVTDASEFEAVPDSGLSLSADWRSPFLLIADDHTVARADLRHPESWRAVWSAAIARGDRRPFPEQLRAQLIAIDRERAERWAREAAAQQRQTSISPIVGPELSGREGVLQELERLCDRPTGPGAILALTGAAGVGKSAVLRGFARTRRAAGLTVLYRNLTSSDIESLDQLFAQIAEELYTLIGLSGGMPPYASERLRQVLEEAVTRQLIGPQSPLFIIVDGLDGPERDRDPLDIVASYIPAPLPRHVYVLTSLRSTNHTTNHVALDATQWRASANAAIRQFWVESRLAKERGVGDEDFSGLLRFCEGNYLIAEMLHTWLAYHPEWNVLRQIWSYKSGVRALVELVRDDVERATQAVTFRSKILLRLLRVAREPLPVTELVPHPAAKPEDADVVRRLLAPLFTAPAGHAPERAMLIDAPSLKESILDIFGDADPPQAHLDLVNRLATFIRGESSATPLVQWAAAYLERYELHHLSIADTAAAFNLVTNVERLTRMFAALGYERAARECGPLLNELDAPQARQRLRDVNPQAVERARTIQSVLREHAHWLRRDPAALSTLVFDTLRARGVDDSRIRDEYKPGPISYLYLRRMVNSRSPSASDLYVGFRGHRAPVARCVAAPEGTVVSISRDAQMRRWQIATGDELWSVMYGEAALSAVAVSSSGTGVCGNNRGTLFSFQLDSGELMQTMFDAHPQGISAIDLSDDGQQMLSASRDGTLKLWERAGAWRLKAQRDVGVAVLDCAITPRGLLVFGRDGSYCLQDRDTLDTLSITSATPAVASSIDHDSAIAVVADAAGTLRGVRLGDDRQLVVGAITSPRAHPSAPPRACVAGEDWLAVGAGNEVRITGLTEPPVIYTHRADVASLAHVRVEDRELLVSASEDHTLCVLDVASRLPLRVLGNFGPGQQLMDISERHPRCVFAAGPSSWAMLHFDATARRDPVNVNIEGVLTALCLAENDQVVVVGLRDGRLLCYRADPLQIIANSGENAHRAAVTALAWDQERHELVSGAEDGTMKAWRLIDATLRAEGVFVGGHRAAVRRIVAQGAIWISCGDDQCVREWHKEGRHARSRFEHDAPVRWFDSNEQGFVVAGGDGEAYFVRGMAQPEAPLLEADESRSGISACAIEGETVALGRDDGKIILCDLAAGRHRLTLEGHTRSVTGLAFIPGGQLISWSLDRTVRQWDLGMRSLFATTYGSAPFVSAGLLPSRIYENESVICALDSWGQLWMLDYILPT